MLSIDRRGTYKRPIFCVDFNEMIGDSTVLPSAADTKSDTSGEEIRLCEGLLVCIRMELDARTTSSRMGSQH